MGFGNFAQLPTKAHLTRDGLNTSKYMPAARRPVCKCLPQLAARANLMTPVAGELANCPPPDHVRPGGRDRPFETVSICPYIFSKRTVIDEEPYCDFFKSEYWDFLITSINFVSHVCAFKSCCHCKKSIPKWQQSPRRIAGRSSAQHKTESACGMEHTGSSRRQLRDKMICSWEVWMAKHSAPNNRQPPSRNFLPWRLCINRLTTRLSTMFIYFWYYAVYWNIIGLGDEICPHNIALTPCF